MAPRTCEARGRRQGPDERGDALALLQQAAQVLVELRARQLGQEVAQRLPQVRLVEEGRVLEARAQHRLVACAFHSKSVQFLLPGGKHG